MRRILFRLLIPLLVLLLVPIVVPNAYRFRAAFRQPQAVDFPPSASGKCLPAWWRYTSLDYRAWLIYPRAFDSSGVTIQDYGSDLEYGAAGWQYTPYFIGATGIIAVQAWCQQHDSVALMLAVRQAQWLITNARIVADAYTWSYDFPDYPFNMPVGWTSAFGDAYPLVLFAQLYAITDDPTYLNAVQRTVAIYRIDVNDGGVRSDVSHGVFYEHVAYPLVMPAHVLNGHLIAIMALIYVDQTLHIQQARQYALDGIAGTNALMYQFDGGSFVYYSLSPRYKEPVDNYDRWNDVDGLRALYAYTDDSVFLNMADKWAAMPGLVQVF